MMKRKTYIIIGVCFIILLILGWIINEIMKRQIQRLIPLREMEERFDNIINQQNAITDLLTKNISISKDVHRDIL